MTVADNILESIGNKPLVRLTRVVPQVVVTLMVDSGIKYVGTDVYR
jgi:hypothetical protein